MNLVTFAEPQPDPKDEPQPDNLRSKPDGGPSKPEAHVACEQDTLPLTKHQEALQTQAGDNNLAVADISQTQADKDSAKQDGHPEHVLQTPNPDTLQETTASLHKVSHRPRPAASVLTSQDPRRQHQVRGPRRQRFLPCRPARPTKTPANQKATLSISCRPRIHW